MVYALVQNSVVVNTVLAGLSDFKDPTYIWVDITTTSPRPSIGWTYADGVFTGPVQIENNAPPISEIPFITTTPNRALNTNFLPSISWSTLCTYTVLISCALNGNTGQTGAVELRSDMNPTPITPVARASNTNSGALTGGVINSQEFVLSYLVPPNYNVRLVSSGTAQISITSQSEVQLQI